jgi:integral membrane protein
VGMPQRPTISDVPRIGKLLRLYRVTSFITGTFLLLLCLMMVFRYLLGVDIELLGPFGFVALMPREQITAINFSTWILVAHGWFYVVYVLSDFALWSAMRWKPLRLLLMFLGGIIPLLSFILERIIHREVVEKIGELESAELPKQKVKS